MYQKILVPLDGSKLAEGVFPQLTNLARGGTVGEIILLSVVEIPSTWVAEGIDFMSLKTELTDKAQTYLAEKQTQLRQIGLNINTEVIEGDAAHSIVEYATQNNVDLIAIATHGYTGIKRLMFGSVALRVLHDSYIPILLIRSPMEEK
jgi:nucleotide-binding universal stress UspA family protein